MDATTAPPLPPKVFTFLNDEIAAGESDIYMPGLDNLNSSIKRYVSGGENKMHTHLGEDHYFFVLAGEATFHLQADENVVVVPAHDAVLIPRGTYYRFASSGTTKLIMLRVANAPRTNRVDPTGKLTDPLRTRVYPHQPARELPFTKP